MGFDWKSVTREHVLKAIDMFLKYEPEYPEAKNTFLIHNGKKLPAKHIRGMAYEVAHGVEISKQDFTGGKETVKFFERLGFEVNYTKKADVESPEKEVVQKNESKNKTVAGAAELPELKVGLYLQTIDKHNLKEFKKAMAVVKESDIDLLVFPEFSYVPFEGLLSTSDIDKTEDIEVIYKECMSLSKEINCAVIIGGCDAYGTIYSVYANADFIENEETDCTHYVKHTATQFSAFDLDNYSEKAKYFFSPIYLKGYAIGMTICNDCTHSLFSSMYGVQGVDIIINCTGGNVVYDKWHKYTQSRAIENSCYTFTTMGGDPDGKSYVYGFSPSGKELTPKLIYGKGTSLNISGGIYVYSTGDDDCKGQIDRSINQNQTENKYKEFMLNSKEFEDVLKTSVKIENNLYVYKYKEFNVVFVIAENENILYPEKFLQLMYSDKLNKYPDKRYIIVNKFEGLEKQFYENKLSVVLKVRAMENYCAVLLLSDLTTMCYQTGQNKNAQVLKSLNGCFNLDLSRMKGPKTIWRNDPPYKKASWSEGYSWLVKQCACLSEYGVWKRDY